MTWEQLAELDNVPDEPDDPPPLYEEITVTLIDRIAAGDIEPGTPLPSSNTLGIEFGVSAETARRGLRLLAKVGFARRVPGSGYQALRPEEVTHVTAKTMPGGIEINRQPADMETWELIATYRLAWNLAQYAPAKPLDKALSNWLAVARQALEQRGEWRPETLPPQSM